MERLEQELNALFRAYREAFEDPEPGADFTPKLWRAIDARRTFVFRLKRMSQLALAAALCLCFIVGGVAITHRDDHISGSYVDVLAEAQPLDTSLPGVPEAGEVQH